MWKLFLDDERELSYIGERGLEWRVVRTVNEAIRLVEHYGMPVEMSLDHDLGMVDDMHGNIVASTTMDFLKWLQQWWDETGKPRVPDFQAHTSNPVGAQNIRSFMQSWLRVAEEEE
jgi:hypothetical protein